MAASHLPDVHLKDVREVFNDGNHNAFTDLCTFNGRYYLTFRSCPDGHMLFTTSQIKVLASDDGYEWKEVFCFNVPQRDVRDPHFLVFQDKIHVYSGTWWVDEADSRNTDVTQHLGYCVHSADGKNWSEPKLLPGTYGYYIWRAATYGGIAYMCGRCLAIDEPSEDRSENQAAMQSWMLASTDGISWQRSALFQPEYGDETAFLFEDDGSVLALARSGRRNAYLCRANPPYSEWTRTELDRPVGGPLIVKWGEHYLAGGRKTVDGVPSTTIYWLVDDQLQEIVTLPSGGDTSYPGFIAVSPTQGLLSYYSSHEGSGTGLAPSAIYLADLHLT